MLQQHLQHRQVVARSGVVERGARRPAAAGGVRRVHVPHLRQNHLAGPRVAVLGRPAQDAQRVRRTLLLLLRRRPDSAAAAGVVACVACVAERVAEALGGGRGERRVETDGRRAVAQQHGLHLEGGRRRAEHDGGHVAEGCGALLAAEACGRTHSVCMCGGGGGDKIRCVCVCVRVVAVRCRCCCCKRYQKNREKTGSTIGGGICWVFFFFWFFSFALP